MEDKVHINQKATGLSVKVRNFGTPKIAELLHNTILGTEGKLRYRQKEIVERMKSQRHLEFIEIVKGTRTLGTTGVVSRNTRSAGETRRSLYVRYLSISKGFKNKKRKNASIFSTQKERNPNRKSDLRDQIGRTITTHFERPLIKANAEAAFYAYVESENVNSRNLCLSMDFLPIRKVLTNTFSRFNPTPSKRAHPTGYSDELEIMLKLNEFYKDYSFYFEDRIFDSGFYFVLKQDNEIIAGVRATPVHWQLVEYPGFEGWLMTEVLPYMPMTNKLFRPGQFNFLAFDYAFYKDENVKLLTELMTHCCALLGFHVGMIWGDAKAPITQDILKSDLGFLHSIVGSVSADLMVRFINSGVEYESLIKEKPVYVSALDMT